MKVRVDKITSTPNGLVMGLQIRGPADSWLRFALLEVPWSSLTPEDVARAYAYWDREREDVEDDEYLTLPLDWS